MFFHLIIWPPCILCPSPAKRSWWPQLIPLQLWKLLKLRGEQKLIGLQTAVQSCKMSRSESWFQCFLRVNDLMVTLLWSFQAEVPLDNKISSKQPKSRSFDVFWSNSKILESPVVTRGRTVQRKIQIFFCSLDCLQIYYWIPINVFLAACKYIFECLEMYFGLPANTFVNAHKYILDCL